VSFESIRERHQRLESMTHTQSPDITRELASQAHEDRGWLIQALEAATQQNDELTRELGRLDAAVDELGARPAQKRKRKQQEEATA
jgi:hypothetical protein